jgi:putative transposase
MKGLKSTAQARYDLRYHFVFVPKYRKRVLNGKIKTRIEGMIRFAAQINEWEIYELAVQPDHVHLYIGAQPSWSPSEIMKVVKGGTSKKIRELFPELDEVYWGSTFWADGYLVKSVGVIQDKVIAEYIKKQV